MHVEEELLDSGCGYAEEEVITESGSHSEQHKDDMVVEKLICGDGSTQRNGYVLEEGVIRVI